MKALNRLILSLLFLVCTHSVFATPVLHSKVSSSSFSSSEFNAANIGVPFSPSGYSLIVYRYRHGIDENHFTIDQPAEIVMDIVPFKHIAAALVSCNKYFASYSSFLPPPPEFLFHTSLRSPPCC